MLPKPGPDPRVQFSPPRKQTPITSASVGHEHPEGSPHFPPLVFVATKIVQRNHCLEPPTVHLQDEGEVSPTEFVVDPIKSHRGDGAIVERVAFVADVKSGGH
jgi:hypothetical protein